MEKNPLEIIEVKFADRPGFVVVKTANGKVSTVTVNYLNACCGCDVNTLKGAVGQIWD